MATTNDAVDWVGPPPSVDRAGGIQEVGVVFQEVPRLNWAGPGILLGSAIVCILLAWFATAYFLLVLACVELWMMMRYVTARRINAGAIPVTVDVSATLALIMQADPCARILADIHIAWSGLNAAMLFISFISFQILVGEAYDGHRPSISGFDFMMATFIVASVLSFLHALFAFFVVNEFQRVELNGPVGERGGGGGHYNQLAQA